MTSSTGYNVWASIALALLYVALYHLADVMAGSQSVGGVASLFFLPAFVRLLGFLIVGLWIIPALFLAGLYLVFTGAYDLGPGNAAEIGMTAFTAVGGPLGVYIASQIGRLDPSLSNLTPLRLLGLSFGCCAGNAIFHHWALLTAGIKSSPAVTDLAVFVGDMIGTWTIIYLIKTGLTIYSKAMRR